MDGIEPSADPLLELRAAFIYTDTQATGAIFNATGIRLRSLPLMAKPMVFS